MSLCSSLLQSSNSSESNQSDEMLFELSDYLTFSDTELLEEYSMTPTSEQQHSPFLLQENGDHINKRSIGVCSKRRNMVKSPSKRSSIKVAFRTKSELEVLDDGYKWRKYGKKMVKNSPNPRNYYRCSTEGCFVKKRVEREQEDSRYVITTYEGSHNHHVPSKTIANKHLSHLPRSSVKAHGGVLGKNNDSRSHSQGVSFDLKERDIA